MIGHFNASDTVPTTEKENTAWYFRPWIIALAILGFGPLGLFLVWFRPETRLYIKILVSAVVLALTAWMTVSAYKYYDYMVNYYTELAELLGSK